MRIFKYDNQYQFYSIFNTKTGQYMRSGILDKSSINRVNDPFCASAVDTGVDPFMASFPELLDVGIMGSCIHGKSGLCLKAGIECYQDGLHANTPNMILEDYESILKQSKGKVFQIALGGAGDPDQHENFKEILELTRRYNIVPNFTTSGLGMTEEIAALCKSYCGAVAVSWYRSPYTVKAIQMLLDAGVKTNIHYVLSNSTLDEAYERLKNNAFPEGINAILFLMHKPVGLGTQEQVIQKDNEKFWKFMELIDTGTFLFKIGFDSCTVPALIHSKNLDMNSLDTCEGARWSAYITPDMKLLPCSFDNQSQKWAVDLRTHSIAEAWNSETFDDFRNHFRNACPNCDKRQFCMGGCPICPDIVLCKKP